MLRAGNAGANTAADHMTVLDLALAQIPAEHIEQIQILVRADRAGATHELREPQVRDGVQRGEGGRVPQQHSGLLRHGRGRVRDDQVRLVPWDCSRANEIDAADREQAAILTARLEALEARVSELARG